MKKLGIVLWLLLFCSAACLADEVIPQQNAEDNKAVISLQKQPANEQQKQKVTRNIACIIIQINGKVKETGGK